MNDSGMSDAQLLEMGRGVFEVLMAGLLAGVILVLLAQVACMALCGWETHRSLNRRKERLPQSRYP